MNEHGAEEATQQDLIPSIKTMEYVADLLDVDEPEWQRRNGKESGVLHGGVVTLQDGSRVVFEVVVKTFGLEDFKETGRALRDLSIEYRYGRSLAQQSAAAARMAADPQVAAFMAKVKAG